MDKYIEFVDVNHITENQKVQVQIKMCDNNGYPFIATLYNVLFVPDICNRVFSIITLINLGHNCLFHKGVCTLYFDNREKMRLLYHIVHMRNMHFWGKIKQMYRSKKIGRRKKFALELLNNRLGNRSTRSLMEGDNVIFCQDIEPRIDQDPFCTSCETSSTNRKARSKNPLKPKAHFKWFLWIFFSNNTIKFDNWNYFF